MLDFRLLWRFWFSCTATVSCAAFPRNSNSFNYTAPWLQCIMLDHVQMSDDQASADDCFCAASNHELDQYYGTIPYVCICYRIYIYIYILYYSITVCIGATMFFLAYSSFIGSPNAPGSPRGSFGRSRICNLRIGGWFSAQALCGTYQLPNYPGHFLKNIHVPFCMCIACSLLQVDFPADMRAQGRPFPLQERSSLLARRRSVSDGKRSLLT